jgi:hypothetical protein
MLIINPGSRVGEPAEGWTNTAEQARKIAQEWLEAIHKEGMRDVELLPGDRDYGDSGRWVFTFRHAVTGVMVDLATHGIDDLDAYVRVHVFHPRIYWNGESLGEPKLEDFAADGFEPVRTWRRKKASGG